MSELALFIGPPADAKDDVHAAEEFLNEKCRKIILGGSTVSIFERYMGCKSNVDLSTACNGLPPYGELNGITVTEGCLTLCRLNEIFFNDIECKDAAGLIKKAVQSAANIKIYLGSASNLINGMDKRPVIAEFIKNIKN